MLVSVLLPIYNASEYLRDCIDSILNQTFTDFELLALDDGSTDDSAAIVKSYDDNRIKLILCEHNFINTLNHGIDISQGGYIARMDADDIMHPQRLAKQVQTMMNDTSIIVCSTWANTFGDDNRQIGGTCGIVLNPLVSFLMGNFVIHPTTMIRKSYLHTHNLKYRPVPYAEDFDLWVNVARAGGFFYIIPETLLKYRVNSKQVTRNHFEEQVNSRIHIQQQTLEYLIKNTVEHKSQLKQLYQLLLQLNDAEIIDADLIFSIFYHIYTNTKTQVSSCIN